MTASLSIDFVTAADFDRAYAAARFYRNRQGIGRAMIEFLEVSMGALGFGEMWLGTETDNESALALYNGAGGQRTQGNGVIYCWTPPKGDRATR
jgi:hypothetical protein